MSNVYKVLHTLVVILLVSYPAILLLHRYYPGNQVFINTSAIASNVSNWTASHVNLILLTAFSLLIYRLFLSSNFDLRNQLRIRHIQGELARYSNTPLVSPLLLYYLLHPPQSISRKAIDDFSDPFYPLLVTKFKRIQKTPIPNYTIIPSAPKSLLWDLGWKLCFKATSITCLLALITINLIMHDASAHHWSKWAWVLCPFISYLLSKVTGYIEVILGHYLYRKICSLKVPHYFGDDQQHTILQFEIEEGSLLSEQILRAWKIDCTHRELQYRKCINSPPGEVLHYTLQTFADRPYEANVQNDTININTPGDSNIIDLFGRRKRGPSRKRGIRHDE